jgi:hypothetical protein
MRWASDNVVSDMGNIEKSLVTAGRMLANGHEHSSQPESRCSEIPGVEPGPTTRLAAVAATATFVAGTCSEDAGL